MRVRSAAGVPTTLGSHHRAGVVFNVWCAVCQTHGREVVPAELVAQFGEGFVTKDVEPYMRCDRCGSGRPKSGFRDGIRSSPDIRRRAVTVSDVRPLPGEPDAGCCQRRAAGGRAVPRSPPSGVH